MNIKILKGIGIFLAGAGVGGFVVSVVLKNKYENIIKEEIESIRYTFNRRNRELLETPMDTNIDGTKFTKKYETLTNQYVDAKNLNSTMSDDDCEEEEDSDEEEINHNICMNDERNKLAGVYLINFESFNDEMPNNIKQSITYYQIDDVLVDEYDEIITDVVLTVGEQALTSFGIGSEDPNIVYVRNNNLSIDYEIILVENSYSEMVLGIPIKKE